MNASEKETITRLYKEAYPNADRLDSGYIFADGTLIDISSGGKRVYYHGSEFCANEKLRAWKDNNPEMPVSERMAADAVMSEIGAVEFTVDNARMQCVRLPSKPLTAEQKGALRGIVARILERGSIRVEFLGTREFAEYDAESHGVEDVMGKIEARNL